MALRAPERARALASRLASRPRARPRTLGDWHRPAAARAKARAADRSGTFNFDRAFLSACSVCAQLQSLCARSASAAFVAEIRGARRHRRARPSPADPFCGADADRTAGSELKVPLLSASVQNAGPSSRPRSTFDVRSTMATATTDDDPHPHSHSHPRLHSHPRWHLHSHAPLHSPRTHLARA